MGQEHIKAPLGGGVALGHYVVAEFAQTGAEVANNILVTAGDDLHTAGVAAKGAAHRKWQPAVDEGIDRRLGLERLPASGEERIADLGADPPLAQRSR